MSLSIIVNADDFGYNETATSRTISFIERGLVSSATIMATGADFDRAAEYAKTRPDISFGVHLALAEVPSLSGNAALGSGRAMSCWAKGKGFKAAFDAHLRAAIELEWSMQIQKCIDSGLKISHIDSHHGVHTKPFTFLPLKNVAAKFGIRRVRNIHNCSDAFTAKQRLQRIVYEAGFRYFPPAFATTKYFMSYSEFTKMPARPADGTVELMCHPGGVYPDEDALIEGDELARLCGIFKLSNWNDIPLRK